MVRLLTAVFLFASFNVVAEVTLTDINNNEVADAEEVMGNFNALKNEIESLPTPPTNCSTDQVIKWDGSAWVCATRSYRINNCSTASCEVECLEGTSVISGSCDIRTNTLDTYLWGVVSRPAPDFGGWYCEGKSDQSNWWEVKAYAICQ